MALPLKPVAASRYCKRCAEQIELANDLDREPDIDRPRRVVFVAGKPRQLGPVVWKLFTLLYRQRGIVVSRALLHRQRQNLFNLRKLLEGSRYTIVNHPTIGSELIVASEPARAKPSHEPCGAKFPRIRDVISAALENAAPAGLSRAEIAAAISRKYGAGVSLNTLTGTLARMHADGRLRLVGHTWFLMCEGKEAENLAALLGRLETDIPDCHE